MWLSPCGLQTIDEVTVSPSGPPTTDDVTVSPCGLQTIDEVTVLPCGPQTITKRVKAHYTTVDGKRLAWKEGLKLGFHAQACICYVYSSMKRQRQACICYVYSSMKRQRQACICLLRHGSLKAGLPDMFTQVWNDDGRPASVNWPVFAIFSRVWRVMGGAAQIHWNYKTCILLLTQKASGWEKVSQQLDFNIMREWERERERWRGGGGRRAGARQKGRWQGGKSDTNTHTQTKKKKKKTRRESISYRVQKRWGRTPSLSRTQTQCHADCSHPWLLPTWRTQSQCQGQRSRSGSSCCWRWSSIPEPCRPAGCSCQSHWQRSGSWQGCRCHWRWLWCCQTGTGRNKIHTHERWKRRLFIRTKTRSANFLGVIPFAKLQNNT